MELAVQTKNNASFLPPPCQKGVDLESFFLSILSVCARETALLGFLACQRAESVNLFQKLVFPPPPLPFFLDLPSLSPNPRRDNTPEGERKRLCKSVRFNNILSSWNAKLLFCVHWPRIPDALIAKANHSPALSTECCTNQFCTFVSRAPSSFSCELITTQRDLLSKRRWVRKMKAAITKETHFPLSTRCYWRHESK